MLGLQSARCQIYEKHDIAYSTSENLERDSKFGKNLMKTCSVQLENMLTTSIRGTLQWYLVYFCRNCMCFPNLAPTFQVFYQIGRRSRGIFAPCYKEAAPVKFNYNTTKTTVATFKIMTKFSLSRDKIAILEIFEILFHSECYCGDGKG